jgi:RNA-directed DNA polymerase
LKKEKQMTASADASFRSWNQIPWNVVIPAVKRLQIRIAEAVRAKKYRKAQALQWLLTHSYYARLLAVKRVVENRGKKTAGVDGEIWDTPAKKMHAVGTLYRRGYKPKALRRIYIPKKNGTRRPLSIPTMRCRAMQALYLLALKPVAETTADPNSYDFREGRAAHDAIAQCFNVLAKRHSAQWILEGDIKACFDEINHEWLLTNVLTDKVMLRKWLNAGFIEKGILYPTEAGTPQGGIASPCLANLTLDGLEQTVLALATRAKPRPKLHVIRYADDFVIVAPRKEVLQEQVLPAIEEFLNQRGLRLSKEKTIITHINDGFDFLGQNVRKYKGKLLIKPIRTDTRKFLAKVKGIIKAHQGLPTEVMIRKLNPVIRGWANYHRHVVSGNTFAHATGKILDYLWRWARRRHSEKGKIWTRRKYFLSGTRNYGFSCKVKGEKECYLLELVLPSDVPVIRHVKVKAAANPYDRNAQDYFLKRKQRKFRLAFE